MNLNKKKYRQTPEREKVYKTLCSTTTHPTAEWIYEQLQEQGESISLATVYRNLSILCEQGKIKKLDVQGSDEKRYDADISDHHHFICSKYNKVRDFSSSSLPTGLSQYLVCSQCM